jgi:hypothetical protein
VSIPIMPYPMNSCDLEICMYVTAPSVEVIFPLTRNVCPVLDCTFCRLSPRQPTTGAGFLFLKPHSDGRGACSRSGSVKQSQALFRFSLAGRSAWLGMTRSRQKIN